MWLPHFRLPKDLVHPNENERGSCNTGNPSRYLNFFLNHVKNHKRYKKCKAIKNAENMGKATEAQENGQQSKIFFGTRMVYQMDRLNKRETLQEEEESIIPKL